MEAKPELASYKPALQSHLDQLTRLCFPGYTRSLGIRFDNVVLHQGQFRATEVVGFESLPYLQRILQKTDQVDSLKLRVHGLELTLVIERSPGLFTVLTREELNRKIRQTGLGNFF